MAVPSPVVSTRPSTLTLATLGCSVAHVMLELGAGSPDAPCAAAWSESVVPIPSIVASRGETAIVPALVGVRTSVEQPAIGGQSTSAKTIQISEDAREVGRW